MVVGVLPVEYKGDGQTKICPKGVNEHRPAHIGSVIDIQIDGLVGRVKHELEERDDNELEGTGSTQDCAHGDQSCGTGKIRTNHPGRRRRKVLESRGRSGNRMKNGNTA